MAGVLSCESMVSLLVPVENHFDVEVGWSAAKGMVGPARPWHRAIAGQGAGARARASALRLSAARFRAELRGQPGAATRRSNGYIHALMEQITQTAASTLPRGGARLARWLLMTRVRMRSPSSA